MGAYAILVCPTRRLTLFLGKPLRDKPLSAPDFKIFQFARGSEVNSEQSELTTVLWRLLADTAGEELSVIIDDLHPDYETVAAWQEIGDDTIDGISFAYYLEGWGERLQRAASRGLSAHDAYLICHARELTFLLGRQLHDEDGNLIGFHLGDRVGPVNSAQPELGKALWKFMADTAGDPRSGRTGWVPSRLSVTSENQSDFDVVAGYRCIGRDIGLAEYIKGWRG